MDPGLEEPIASILWAAPRLMAEVKELQVVSDQFTAKYGKEFTHSCRSNQLSNVNEKLMHKLSVQAPPKLLVEKYLEEIAKTYNVPFVPQQSEDISAAEGLLIDFNERKNGPPGGPSGFGGGASGGGGGGGGMIDPRQPPIGFATAAMPHPSEVALFSNLFYSFILFSTFSKWLIVMFSLQVPNQAPYPVAAGPASAQAPPFTNPNFQPDQPPSYTPQQAPSYSSSAPPPLPPNHPNQKSEPVVKEPELPDLPDLPTVPSDNMPEPAGTSQEAKVWTLMT